MRRFERMLAKPVEIWEVELKGQELHSRAGIKGGDLVDHVEAHASEAEAAARLDAEIAARKKLGFVEIKRVAPAERPVHRTQMFEWEEPDGRRLFQIVQRDRTVTVRDPREPTTNTTTTASTTHATIAAASAAYDQEAEKLRRLSTTVEERAADRVRARLAAGEPFDAKLEEQCLTTDDPGAWSALAELLRKRDHPAGKLAARFDAAAVTRALPAADEFLIGFRHAHGFVRSLHFTRRENGESDTHCLASLVERCLDLPILRMTHVLSFGVEHTIDNTWTATLQAVAGSPVRNVVRALSFDAWDTAWGEGNKHCYGHDDTHESCQGYGDFSSLLEDLPLLERLEIASGGMGGKLGEGTRLPRLRVLARRSKGLRASELLELATLEVPALESLELTFGRRADRCVKELAELLTELAAPRLTHLALRGHREAGASITDLAKAPLLRQLRTLDLTGSQVSEGLMRHAEAFRHLERVTVTSPTAKLMEALPNVGAADRQGS